MAKGTGARRIGSRQQSPPAPPSPPSNQGIRLWLAALAVAFAQLAMGESGLHGQTLFGALIASTIATVLVAAFFNHLTDWFPRLDLSRRLRAVAQPKAFFFLFCLAVAATWLLDYTARITMATTPAGSYQAPQAQDQKFPLTPTHARLHFATGSKRAQPYGKQENVHAWNSINTGSSLGPTGQTVVFERTIITVVFSQPTEVSQLYIYQVGSGDRTIPKYDIISSDERFAQIEFYGNLSGLDIDITNMQNK